MITAFFKAIASVFTIKVIRRKFYAEFGAFIIASAFVKLNGDINNETKSWEDVAPSIYDLDAIVNEMNENRDYLNEIFNLSVNEWTRDDIRRYLDILDTYHFKISNLLGKDVPMLELCARYNMLCMMPLISLFKTHFAIHMANMLSEQR